MARSILSVASYKILLDICIVHVLVRNIMLTSYYLEANMNLSCDSHVVSVIVKMGRGGG